MTEHSALDTEFVRVKQEPKLLPCPFCGTVPMTHEIPAHTHSPMVQKFMPDHLGSWVIECGNCPAGMIADTLERCAELWNARALPVDAIDTAIGLLLDAEMQERIKPQRKAYYRDCIEILSALIEGAKPNE